MGSISILKRQNGALADAVILHCPTLSFNLCANVQATFGIQMLFSFVREELEAFVGVVTPIPRPILAPILRDGFKITDSYWLHLVWYSPELQGRFFENFL